MDPNQTSGKTDSLTVPKKGSAPLIERAPLPMVEVEGPDHVVCFANAAFCRLLGKTRDELVGKSFVQIVHRGDKCRPVLDRVYETGEFETHVESGDSDSDPAYWLYAMWPALGADDRPERVVIQLTKAAHFHQNIAAMNEALLIGALRQHELREEAENVSGRLRVEITARHHVELALREGESRLAAILEHIPVGVSLMDTEGRTVLCNSIMQRFVPELIPSFDKKRIDRWQAWAPDGTLLEVDQWPGRRALRGETVVPGIEFKYTGDDGRKVWTSIATAPLRNPLGRVTGAVVMMQDISERKRVDEVLRASERRVSGILASITDSFYVVDANWRISDMNAAARQTYLDNGLDPETMLGKDLWRDVFPATVGTPLEAEYRRAMSERIAREFEYYYAPWQRWFSIRVYPIEQGGITVYFRDITESKLAAEKLRMSEERFRALVTASSDVVYRMSADWSEMLRLDGRKFLADTDTPSRTWLEQYIHPDDQPRVVAVINAAIRNRKTFELEHRVARADGSWGWTFSRAVPLLDAAGEIMEWFGSASDISGRKEAEAARLAGSERFRFLAESMPQKVFTANAVGTTDYYNRQWVEYATPASSEPIKDWDWLEFVHPDDIEESGRRWRHSLETGDYFEMEHRVRRHDGEYRWHLSRVHAMRDLRGSTLMWIGSTTDVDDARRTLEEVSRSVRGKDAFLAALSHELRTPLTPVLMTAAALREDDRLPLDVREQIGMIERNIALEARLIDDLLDLTRISHGKLALRAQPCDAHNLIGFALEIVRQEASEKQILIECALGAEHNWLTADPTRFQQVVWNLLRNAVKFTPSGGKIFVQTRDEKSAQGESWLRIEVKDTGVGIAKARLEQIFLPFDQGGLTGDHRFGGVGLGLAIARAVVDLHGGRISAQSAGPGFGATFVVELPGAVVSSASVADPAAPFSAGPWAPPSENPKISPSVRPLRLLVVEDHANTLQTLLRLLRRDGHSVVPTDTVARALAAAAEEKFDLVISDLGLPDGTGTELMGKLRSGYGLRGIALSGYGMEEDLVRSREAGFVSHLVKPVSLAELRRAIAEVKSAEIAPAGP